MRHLSTIFFFAIVFCLTSMSVYAQNTVKDGYGTPVPISIYGPFLTEENMLAACRKRLAIEVLDLPTGMEGKEIIDGDIGTFVQSLEYINQVGRESAAIKKAYVDYIYKDDALFDKNDLDMLAKRIAGKWNRFFIENGGQAIFEDDFSTKNEDFKTDRNITKDSSFISFCNSIGVAPSELAGANKHEYLTLKEYIRGRYTYVAQKKGIPAMNKLIVQMRDR